MKYLHIYRIYFNNNILDKINNLKCFRNFYLNVEKTKKIKCNLNLIDSSFVCFVMRMILITTNKNQYYFHLNIIYHYH